MKNTLEILIKTLEKDERLVVDGELLKNKVIELTNKMDADLLKLLKSEKDLKKHFFVEIDDVLVFDKQQFFDFVNNKNFLADSFTKYKNTIGLSNEEKYFSESNEVVLAWPYKDTVLEGGQSKEDAKRNEIFHNEILAPDQIDRLLDPKVFTNFKKYTTDVEEKLNGDEDIDFENENLIIKGNNLIALHSLKRKFAGKVKLIYMDPPYNTENDGFMYNDRFNHSTWLTFMNGRLKVLKDLLKEDGLIFISINDIEIGYLKVLMDEVFGRDNFFSIITWRQLHTVKNSARHFSKSTEYILVYGKSANKVGLLRKSKDKSKDYPLDEGDGKGKYKLDPLSARNKNTEYTFIFDKWNIKWEAPEGSYPRYSKETLQNMYENDEIVYKKGWKSPLAKRYLSDVQEGVPPSTHWMDDEIDVSLYDDFWDGKRVGFSSTATSELAKVLSRDAFLSPKPESLIKQILDIGTQPGDLFLDATLGSGTSVAVAHKMGRRYIGIEQMDYINDITVPRLQKVIGKPKKGNGKLIEELDYDEGGVSKDVNWQGGGSFLYCEIAEWNEDFVQKVQKAKDKKELEKIWQEMQKKSFLSHKIDIKKIDEAKSEYEELSFEDKKKFLIETLDKNYLYIPYSEIDDEEFGVSEQDKKLNKKFYKN